MSKQTFRRADYYSTLDSMRFNFSRHDRTDIQRNQISAAGTVMLGLLIGDTKPVLTQAQAIDNAYVLELLAAEDSSSSGFLDLVEERTIQVRFHDRPPLIDGPHRLTLVNAFASALARGENFVLSGWPELNDEIELRQELSQCIARQQHDLPSMLKSVEPLVSPTVFRRFKGLVRFSVTVAESRQDQLTKPPGDGTYRRLVLTHLRRLRAHRQDAEDVVRWLEQQARIIGRPRPDGSVAGANLDQRSGWLQLLKIYEVQHPEQSAAIALAYGRLDYAMHDVIARSLNCTGREIQAIDIASAQEISDSDKTDMPLDRLVHLVDDESKGDWLTWQAIPGIRRDLRHALHPADRLEILIRRHKDYLWASHVRDLNMKQVTIGLPCTTMLTAGAGVVENQITNFMGGPVSASIATVAGTLTLLVLGRLAVRGDTRVSQHLRQRNDARWERSIPGGTASWQQKIRT